MICTQCGENGHVRNNGICWKCSAKNEDKKEQPNAKRSFNIEIETIITLLRGGLAVFCYDAENSLEIKLEDPPKSLDSAIQQLEQYWEY